MSMIPTSVREAALLYSDNDAECTATQVAQWPRAAVRTIEALLEDARFHENPATLSRIRIGLRLRGLVESAAAQGERWAGPLLHAAKEAP